MVDRTNVKFDISKKEDINHKLTGIIFLIGVSGIFIISGFSSRLAALRKCSPTLFKKNWSNHENNRESGNQLALRALAWGSLYSLTGCSIFVYSIWKMSGASSFVEFRQKMGKLLPAISKDTPSF